MFRGALLAACAIALVACATPYQESGFTGGYGVTALGQDVYRITFQGNGYTTRETAQVYWLNRAADVAIEKGFAGFETLSDMHFSLRLPSGVDGLERVRLAATAATSPAIASTDELIGASAWRPNGPAAAGDWTNDRVRVAAGTVIVVPTGSGPPHPGLEGDIHLTNKAVESAPPKIFNARALHAALAPIVNAENKCAFGNVCPHVHAYLLPKGTLQ